MKIRQTLWAIPLLGMLATPGMAVADRYYEDGYHDNRFEQRLERQLQRIKHGVRSGKLTHREAKRLRQQHRAVARLERKFSRDGVLDRHERRALRRELDAMNDRIRRLKNNDRVRAEREAPYLHPERYGYIDGWSVGIGIWNHP